MTDAMDETEVDKHTAIDVYQWLREVCTTKLLQTPTILGGPGIIVQIDDSLFRHKPRLGLGLGRLMVAKYSVQFLIVHYFQHHTEEEAQLERCGYLGLLIHQHWATWKL